MVRTGKRVGWIGFFLNAEWFQVGQWFVKALCRKHSDHKPLLLYGAHGNWGPKPFSVFNCFLNETLLVKIQSLVKDSTGWKDLDIHRALKEIKSIIKASSKEGKSQMEMDISALENRLNLLESTDAAEEEQQALTSKLRSLYSRKESMLKQKARLKWFKLGDGNSKFFHQVG